MSQYLPLVGEPFGLLRRFSLRLTRKSLCLGVDFLEPEEKETDIGYAS